MLKWQWQIQLQKQLRSQNHNYKNSNVEIKGTWWGLAKLKQQQNPKQQQERNMLLSKYFKKQKSQNKTYTAVLVPVISQRTTIYDFRKSQLHEEKIPFQDMWQSPASPAPSSRYISRAQGRKVRRHCSKSDTNGLLFQASVSFVVVVFSALLTKMVHI